MNGFINDKEAFMRSTEKVDKSIETYLDKIVDIESKNKTKEDFDKLYDRLINRYGKKKGKNKSEK